MHCGSPSKITAEPPNNEHVGTMHFISLLRLEHSVNVAIRGSSAVSFAIMSLITVEWLGMSYFVHCSEAVPSLEVEI